MDHFSKQLREMFEGDSADRYGGKFPLMSMGGLSGGSCMRRPGSEDPHRHERNFKSGTFSVIQTTLVEN